MRLNDDSRMLVRKSRVRGPMSRMQKELEALVTKLKNILLNKRRTQVTATTPIPLTLRNKTEVAFWKRQEEVLGDEDTMEEHSHYSNYSFHEGSEMVSKEELDPEEHLHIYYDPDEDAFYYQPADIVSDMDGPEWGSDTSGTFSRTFGYVPFTNSEDGIL
ncbi:hypothetical protein SLA2020_429240 [Shorea laevis]